VIMLLADALMRRGKIMSWSNIIATAVASVGFGMIWAFDWRGVLHGWIPVLFVIVVLGAFGAGIINRRARNRA
jgi:hypothetical protein